MSKQSESVIRWRRRTKAKMVSSMGGKCQCCGYDKCIEALEFHHLDLEGKDFGLGNALKNPRNLGLIIEELKKCILLCSICHKEVHYIGRPIPDNYAVLNEEELLSERDLRKRTRQQTGVVKAPIDRRKIFLTKEELTQLLEQEFENNKSALARYLKVSEAAVRKKLSS